MGEAVAAERRAVVEEITRALGDDVALGSRAWWQYVTVLAELGEEAARQLVQEAHAVEAAGGMPTKDGSRRRTPGGVFFALAYEQLGPKRTKAVRSRADRHFQEEMLGKFLKLLALVLPAGSTVSADAAAPTAPAPERAAKRERAAKPEPAPREPAAKAAAAKPPRRQETEAVEVMVVRRRPPGAGAGSGQDEAASGPPAHAGPKSTSGSRARKAGASTKSGPTTPRAGG